MVAQLAEAKKTKSKGKSEHHMTGTLGTLRRGDGRSGVMLRAGCWRERLSNSRDVADPTGDLSGRLAEEVNRRPLFCRAGHRRGSNGSDPVFVDRSTACPAPLLLGPSEDSADPKSGKPLRGEPPGTQTPNYGARGATLANLLLLSG